MSRITFHSEHGDADVSGVERHHAGMLCSKLLLVALGAERSGLDDDSPLRALLPPEHYVNTSSQFLWAFGVFCNTADDDEFRVGDIRTSPFTASLNTALVMGSDPIRLLARLHGQCEIHTYVEGPNRAWLAGIIEEGLKSGVMRPRCHWEDAISLLRSRDDGPVVTSYSVCESFPNPDAAEWKAPDNSETGEPDTDAWYDLPASEQWRMAIDGLRKNDHGLEMKPDRWATYFFGSGVNGFQLREAALAATENANVRW